MLSLPVSSPRFTSSSNTTHRTPRRERFAMTPLSTLAALGASCTRAEILLYTSIALHADRNGFAFPGRNTLSAITGLPANRISKASASLARKGFIRKEHPDPFHVQYYLLPIVPPAAPVEPPEPAPSAVPPSAPCGTAGCRPRHEPVPPTAPLTEQPTDQKAKKTERAPRPEPEPLDPTPSSSPDGAHTDSATPPKPQQRVVPLPAKTTLEEDWTLPDDYRQWAAEHRPDLRDRLTPIAEGFRDFHLSRATRSASWRAEWRRWISRERAPKPTQNRSTTPPSDSRYPKPDARKDLAAAQKAEQERAYRAKHDAWLFEQAALIRQRQATAAAATAAATTPSDHPQSPPDNDSTHDGTPQQPTPTTKRPLGRLAGLVKEALNLTNTQRPLERGG